MLTPDDILRIARQHEQYADTREPTIRGKAAIVALVRDAIAAHEAQIREVPPLPELPSE